MTGPVLHVVIPGTCPPAPRPRARLIPVKNPKPRKNGNRGLPWAATVYTPEGGPYSTWKAHGAKWVAYALELVEREGDRWPRGSDPIEVRLLFVMPLAESKHRKTRHVPREWCRSHVRGDADNLAKGPLDASNAVLWTDDRDVVRLHVEKIVGEQGEPARTEMMVRRLTGADAHRTDFERVREELRESGVLIGPEFTRYEPCQQEPLSLSSTA